MAKKLTQAERRNILLYSSFTDDELDDPRVIAAAESLKRKEEQRRQEELRHRWDNVTGGVSTSERDTPPPAQDRGLLESLGSFMAGGAGFMADGLVNDPGNLVSSVGNNLASSAQSLWGGFNRMDADATRRAIQLNQDPSQINSGGDAALAAVMGPLTPLFRQLGGDSWADEADARANRANAAQDAASQRAQQDIAGIDWFGGQTLANALGGVANPQSISSMVPVVGPGLAAVLSYPSNYNELRRAGASPEEAAYGAAPAAAAEYAGARIGNAIHIPVSPLSSTASRAAARWASETAQETVGEGLTALMQSGNYANVASTTDNPKLEAYANMRAGQWGQDLWQSTVGSLILGGAHATPQAAWQYAAEMGAYNQQQLQGFKEARDSERAYKEKNKLSQAIIDAGNEALNAPKPRVKWDQATNSWSPLDASLQPKQQLEQDEDTADDTERNISVEELQKLRDEARGQEPPATAATTEPEQEEPNVTTPSMVWQALADKRGSRDSNIATTLLARKKVKIVNDASEIPGDAKPVGTAGWYDGQNTYVVASSLNKDNILPELMSVMGHEVKHGVDASGYEHVLGKQANDALVAQATKLAKSGDERAIRAFNSATGGDDFNKQLSELEKRELVSYSINNAMDDSTGGWAAIKRTAAAAWRDKARDLGLNKDDVKIEDLRYLTKSMLESVAVSDRSLQGQLPEGADGQQMIVSDGLNAAQRELEGRAWSSVDGHKKYFVSDSKSSFVMPKNTTAPKKADRVLQHEELFNEVPELRGVNVVFENEPNSRTLGRFDPTVGPQGTIYLNTGRMGTDTSRFGLLHNTMLHEMQHAAQGVAGSTNGASPYEFMPTSILELKDRIDNGTASAEETTKYNKVYDKAYKLYRKVLGEQEAHFTADSSQLTQAELEEQYPAGPEAMFAKEHNGIIDREINTLAPNPNPVAGMAQIITPRDKTQASAATDSTRDKVFDLTNKNGRFAEVYRRFARSVYGDRGLGRQLNEIELSVANQAASLANKGAQLDAHLEDAINTAAEIKGNTKESVMGKIDEIITEANKHDSAAQRKSVIARLDREFAGTLLGTKINLIRENNWEMANKLIDYRIADGRPLTTKELNTYKKMLDEQERWATRAYQSQMGGRDLYAKTFMNRAKDGNSQESKDLAEALDVLKKGYLSIPDKKTLEDLSTNKLQELYKAWDIGGPRGLDSNANAQTIDALGTVPDDRDFLLGKLDFLRNVAGEKLDAKAMEIAKDLIGVNKQEGAGASMIRGMRQNRTVLEARSKIPKELRKIMGEVTDPRLRLAISTARLTQIVSSTRALTDLYQQGEGVWWSSEKSDKFGHALSSPTFGPLDGKYVSNDTFDMLGAYTKYNETFDAAMQDVLKSPGKALGRAAEAVANKAHALSSWAKFTSIVTNPASGALNFIGSGMTLLKNGITNPVHAYNGFTDTAKLFLTSAWRNADPERMALNQELLLAGVVDSAQAQELRSKEFRSIANELRDINTDSKLIKAKNRVGDVLRMGKSGAGTLYAFMDVWTKTATYYQNKASREAYYKAEGMDVSKEQLIREAGYDTALSTISYNRASPLIKLIERNVPFGGAFATYNAEAIRSTFGGLQVASQYIQMAKDAKTPEGKRIASTRAMEQIGGTLAATAGVIAGTTYLLNSADDEDKKKRALFPDWEKTKIHIFLGKDDKGREHYASVNRADPIGPVNEPVVSFIQALQEDGGTVGDATMAALSNYGTTLANTTNFLKLFTDLGKEAFGNGPSTYTKESAIERAFPDFAGDVKTALPYGNVGANAMVIADTVTPSWAIGILDPERLNVKGEGEQLAGWLKKLGYKDVVVDPQKSLGFRAMDYKNGIKELNGKKDKLLRNSSNPDAIMAGIQDLRDQEMELFKNLSEATLSYREFSKPLFMEGIKQDTSKKLDEDNAYDVLKDNGIPKNILGDVLQGTFISTVADDELVDKWVEVQTKRVQRNDPDYAQKLEDIDNKAALLEKSLRLDRSED